MNSWRCSSSWSSTSSSQSRKSSRGTGPHPCASPDLLPGEPAPSFPLPPLCQEFHTLRARIQLAAFGSPPSGFLRVWISFGDAVVARFGGGPPCGASFASGFLRCLDTWSPGGLDSYLAILCSRAEQYREPRVLVAGGCDGRLVG